MHNQIAIKLNIKKTIGLFFGGILLIALCSFFAFFDFRSILFTNKKIMTDYVWFYYLIKVFMIFATFFFLCGFIVIIKLLIIYNHVIILDDEYMIDRSSGISGGKIYYKDIETVIVKGMFLCICLKEPKKYLKKYNPLKRLIMIINNKMKFSYITISDQLLDINLLNLSSLIINKMNHSTLKIIDLNKYSKLGLSFEKNENLMIRNYKSLFLFYKSNLEIKDKRNVITEISLLRHASSYALLGIEFTPSNDKEILIEIRYGDSKEKYSESLSINHGHTYVGLPEEYLVGVETGVKEYFQQEKNIPAGKLIFNMSAHCYYGSSIKIFTCLTKILLEILFHHNADMSNEQAIEMTRWLMEQEFNYKK